MRTGRCGILPSSRPLLGFFRNRGTDVIPEVVDHEGAATRAVAEGKKWLADPNADWEAGLQLAEREANLLEAAQLIAMHDLPTRPGGPVAEGDAGRARAAEYACLADRTWWRSYRHSGRRTNCHWEIPQRGRIPGWIR